ncbi:hypothetical protein [Arenibacter sp. ARW7G5Y1]|uniref:hypothetical protein n=1 Tax=Arenibacter sp. ARW7G5Y1 TaxID=2135619 RepID=UPI000D76DEBA|nr:hypothetical protein [Arenibacter sp. ARW7G5Y1]
MLNKYFSYSIFWDLLIAVVFTSTFFILVYICYVIIPTEELLLSIVTDISNIAFTSAGFVLTFLTLLVSFKISAKPIKRKKGNTLEDTYKKVSIFNLFLNSPLYVETIRHLKNGVKELLVIAILGFSLKLLAANIKIEVFFYFSIFGIVIISLVLWRSLLVLSGVLSVQDKSTD